MKTSDRVQFLHLTMHCNLPCELFILSFSVPPYNVQLGSNPYGCRWFHLAQSCIYKAAMPFAHLDLILKAYATAASPFFLIEESLCSGR